VGKKFNLMKIIMALLFPPWVHFDNAEMPIGSQMATQSAPLMASQTARVTGCKKGRKSGGD